MTAPKRVGFEDENVRLYHGVEVNDIETATGGNRGGNRRGIGVELISQGGQERLNMVGQHGRHKVNVAGGRASP